MRQISFLQLITLLTGIWFASPLCADETVRLILVGDMMHHRGQLRVASADKAGLEAGYVSMWLPIRDSIAGADLAVGNLECPVAGGAIGHFPAFNAPLEFVTAAGKVGFDVLGLANNHSIDRGFKGFATSFQNVIDASMVPIGDANPVSFVVKNQRVSMLAFSDFVNAGVKIKPGVRIPLVLSHSSKESRALLLETVKKMRAESDLVILSIHWGHEYSTTPPSWARQWAQELADAGVDIIVGHHPHVIGPVEWLAGRDGHKTLVAYSLGNFSSGMDRELTSLGYMLSVEYSNGSVVNANPRLVWTLRDVGPKYKQVYQTILASELQADCAERGYGKRTGAAPWECARFNKALKSMRSINPGTITTGQWPVQLQIRPASPVNLVH